ncbi:hypothetical protein GM672_03465 [Massilia buxea]|uniref:Uncharacterized protein n=1 Tax=Pseudoduganella buxea TaxID=1949069 RepID=A0A6I3SVH5_9BURK|nr:hypothetical protein [Pseudoduganella buxea]
MRAHCAGAAGAASAAAAAHGAACGGAVGHGAGAGVAAARGARAGQAGRARVRTPGHGNGHQGQHAGPPVRPRRAARPRYRIF